MKWIFTALMGLGVVAALCASLLVASLHASAGSKRPTDDVEPQDVEIMVATRSLPAISVIDASAVTTETVKATEMPEGALTSPASVVGQVLVAPVVEGQPFTKTLLAANKPGMHLSATLPEGMRAMSVVLSHAAGLRGLLYPGSIVDIVASFRMPTSTEDNTSGQQILSTVLLEGVEVLAVGGESVVASSDDPSDSMADRRRQTVTVMVDTRQAEILQLATGHGEISLTMRNPLDQGATVDRGVLLTDLGSGITDRMTATETLPPLVANRTPEDGAVRPGAGIDVEDTPSTATMPWVEGADRRALLGEEAKTPKETPVWRMLVLRGAKREVYKFPMAGSDEEEPTRH